MLEKFSVYVSTIITLCVMFSQYFFITGLKCDLKGMVNNRVQCLLHDRGINVADYGVTKINGTLIWKSTAANRVDLQPWRYSTGLDRNKTFFSGDNEEDFQDYVRDHVPNSRWCGDEGGDVPLTYEDLRFFMQTDKCCKEHEACNRTLGVKSTKGNITNIGLMRRFHCDCENDFHACLKKVNSGTGNKIGFTYFTLYGPQCFKEDYPIVNCTKRKGNRCLEYTFNRAKKKRYEWFDIPLY